VIGVLGCSEVDELGLVSTDGSTSWTTTLSPSFKSAKLGSLGKMHRNKALDCVALKRSIKLV
jgi:hypothetical protein